jgi:hypothetical protein
MQGWFPPGTDPSGGTIYGTTGFPYQEYAGTDLSGLQWLMPNPERIADANEGMKGGYGAANRIEGAGAGQEANALNSMGNAAAYGMQTPNVNLNTDPTIAAAWQNFNTNMMPTLQNQNELAGLGHTNFAGKNIADAWMGQLAPLATAAQGYGERAIERGQQGMQTYGNTALQVAANQANKTKTAADTLWGQGTQYRTEVQQPALTAAKKEADAQKSFAQQVLLSPLGNFVPASIGSTTSGK